MAVPHRLEQLTAARFAMVTRPPLDRLRQIIAQSWYWIGGFTLPTDMTANNEIIPTATSSYLKRAVVIESMGLDD